MSAPLAAHIEAAIAGIKAYNDLQSAWRANVKAGGYAAHFKDAPQIPDYLLTELLEVITDFDCDPQGTLDELRLQNEPFERDYKGYIRIADEQWDYYTAQGVRP